MSIREHLVALLLVIVAFAAVAFSAHRAQVARDEAERYKQNSAALMSDIERYRTADSLNAVRVQSLSLTIDEFKRLRARDAATIEGLKAKNRHLESITKEQSEALYELSCRPIDTIMLVDSIPMTAKAVRCGDDWYDFQGVLTDDAFTGQMNTRDSIMIVETVKYKRFLGFLWKTGVRDRRIDLTNANPHSVVQGFEHIFIED